MLVSKFKLEKQREAASINDDRHQPFKLLYSPFAADKNGKKCFGLLHRRRPSVLSVAVVLLVAHLLYRQTYLVVPFTSKSFGLTFFENDTLTVGELLSGDGRSVHVIKDANHSDGISPLLIGEQEKDLSSTGTTEEEHSFRPQAQHHEGTMISSYLYPKFWYEIPISSLGGPELFDPWIINRTIPSPPTNQSIRFPSVDDRVQLYMGDWYWPPCTEKDKIHYRYEYDTINGTTWPALRLLKMIDSTATSTGNDVNTQLGETNTLRDAASLPLIADERFESIVQIDTVFLLEGRVLEDCARLKRQYQSDRTKRPSDWRVQKRLTTQFHCRDVKDLWKWNEEDAEVVSLSNATLNYTLKASPVLTLFGDGLALRPVHQVQVPIIAKYRPATNRSMISVADQTAEWCRVSSGITAQVSHAISYSGKQEINNMAMAPIIWQLERKRHFSPVNFVKNPRAVIPWKDKINKGLWLGAFTGLPYHDLQQTSLSLAEICRVNQRCNFVRQHWNSSWIDAGFTALQGRLRSHDDDEFDHTLPASVVTTRSSMNYKDMTKYKVLVSLEGNDISSGLKWQLMSNSVVLMPPPTWTSWAMEEVLQPWVHYIPLYPNGSNAEAMVQWVVTHDVQAQRIAEHARLFMSDLIDHPEEHENIQREIVKRYRAHWKYVP